MWNSLVNGSSRLTLAVALGITMLVPGRALAQQLKLDQLDRLAPRAKETVNVTLDEGMLQSAGGFLFGQNKPPSETAKQVIAGLKGVYVRTFEFDKPGAYTKDDLDSVRSQLKAPWSRIVSLQDKDESVDIYMWQPGGQSPSGGMAIVVAEPTELTIVNIVGNINLANLASLGDIFGVPLMPGTNPPPPPSR